MLASRVLLIEDSTAEYRVLEWYRWLDFWVRRSVADLGVPYSQP